MDKFVRDDVAEYLVTAGLRFVPGDVALKTVDAPAGDPVDVGALLDRLAALNEAPRKRVLRHTLRTAPMELAEVR